MAFLLDTYFWFHALDNNLFQIPWQVPQPHLMLWHPQSPTEPFDTLHSTVLWAHVENPHVQKLVAWTQTNSQQATTRRHLEVV